MRPQQRLASTAAGLAIVLVWTITSAQVPSSAIAVATSLTLPDRVTSLTIINGSASIAAGLADGQVVVWNGRDAAAPVILPRHGTRILALGSSADGRAIWSLDQSGSLTCTAVDITTLTASSAGRVPATSRQLNLGTDGVGAAAFSADGSLVVVGSQRGELRVFDTESGALRHQIRGHRTEVQALAVRPGTSIVATASAEADLRIWDMARGREIAALDGVLSLFALAFSPTDGALASGGVDRRLTLRDPATYKEAHRLALRAPRLVAALAWSPDGGSIALADIDDATLSKGTVEVVDAATRGVVSRLDTSGVPVAGVAFAGNATLVGFGGPLLRAWSIPAPSPRR